MKKVDAKTFKESWEAHVDGRGGELEGQLDGYLDDARAEDHSCHHLFDWDDARAGHAYRKGQLRGYIRQITIIVEPVTTSRPVVTVKTEPAFVSPTESRPYGGGYVPLEEAIQDHLKQGRMALVQWLRRYESRMPDDVVADVKAAIAKLSQAKVA